MCDRSMYPVSLCLLSSLVPDLYTISRSPKIVTMSGQCVICRVSVQGAQLRCQSWGSNSLVYGITTGLSSLVQSVT